MLWNTCPGLITTNWFQVFMCIVGTRAWSSWSGQLSCRLSHVQLANNPHNKLIRTTLHNTHKYYPIFNPCFWSLGVISVNQTALANAEHHKMPWYCRCTSLYTTFRRSQILYNLVNIQLNKYCYSSHLLFMDPCWIQQFPFNKMLTKWYKKSWAPRCSTEAGTCTVSRYSMVFCIF